VNLVAGRDRRTIITENNAVPTVSGCGLLAP
jgi:hypothetical protein